MPLTLTATKLVCVECRREVVMLSIGARGTAITFPCGHSAGYTSVPAFTLEPDAAA